jgi:hypothetical protein
MRNISFSLTLDSFADGTKDVTRRIWKHAWVQAGDHMMAVEKAQGLGKGGKINRLGEIKIISCVPETLDRIRLIPIRDGGRSEMEREGFPKFTPYQFIEFFCKANKCKEDQIVYRIVFEHVKQ